MDKIKAVIFDMDGVLVDSPAHWQKMTQEFLVKNVPNWNKEKSLAVVGLGLEEMYEKLKSFDAKFTKEYFFDFCEEAANKIYREKTVLYEGVLELLEKLQTIYKIALASSAPKNWVDMTKERFYLDIYFDIIVTAEDVVKCKPAPDIFLLAAERMKVRPEECLVIEDSLNGLEASHSAGMRTLIITNTFSKEAFSRADKILPSLKGLENLSFV